MTDVKEDAPHLSDSSGSSAAEHLPSLKFLDAARLRFHRPAPDHPLRLTVEGDRSYLRVSARAAFPLSDREHFIELYDGSDETIGVIRSLDELSPDDRDALRAELDRRYFTPVIIRIDRVRRELGLHRWDVVTDRGERSFTVKSLREDVEILSDGRIRLKDVEGRIYEIPDPSILPPPSRKLLEELL